MKLILSSLAGILIASIASSADATCKCRARGVIATEGQTLCIWTPEGVRLARCGKVLNVSSWTFLKGPCPQAKLDAPVTLSGSAQQNAALH